MQITAAAYTSRKASDVLWIPCWEGGKPAAKGTLPKEVKVPLALGDFKGKCCETQLVYVGGTKEKRALLIGLGKKEKATTQTIREAYGSAVALCRKLKLVKVAALLPEAAKLEVVRGVVDGLLLANDSFDLQKHDKLKEEPTVLLKSMQLLGATPKEMKLVKQLKGIDEGVKLARTLINQNADDITPQFLVKTARSIAKRFEKVSCTVLNQARIEKEQMGLLLAVSRGSTEDAAMMILEYKGAPRSKDKTCIVGKGITYDTGGLNIKPTGSMETMRTDMSGSAVVLGTVLAAAAIGLPVNITGIAVSAENCVDARSYKPGDVYKSYAGKTVEIANTDAEGRLVLADALAYAEAKLKPTRMIDLATLTGSIVIALGEEVAGLMTDDEKMCKGLLAAGETTGEPLWRMPLIKSYNKQLKSDVADMKNCGTRAGGSITAGLFLQSFVKKTPWAHLDIAGTAYPDKARTLSPNRATGYGVRLLVEYLSNL